MASGQISEGCIPVNSSTGTATNNSPVRTPTANTNLASPLDPLVTAPISTIIQPFPSLCDEPENKTVKKSGKGTKKAPIMIPYSRVRMMMKTAADVPIAQESINTAAKATELFVKKLVQSAHSEAKQESLLSVQRDVQYRHICAAIRKHPKQMQFLYEFVPQKVTGRDYLAMIDNEDT